MTEQVRLGAALFNADQTRLGEAVRLTEAAGIDFFHLDVFDGYLVPDQAFAPRTIKALRPLTQLPFEVHLSAREPERFLKALAEAGANLVFLPAESTPLLYETIYTVRELGMKAGLCLALGTPLAVLASALPMLDAVLLLGRVTGEGMRGRDFNHLVIERIRSARQLIDASGRAIDLQAAGGLEFDDCLEAANAGAKSLPIGGAFYREADPGPWLSRLREKLPGSSAVTVTPWSAPTPTARGEARYRVLVASRSFGKNCPEVLEAMRDFGCDFIPNPHNHAPTEAELQEQIGEADALISGTEPVTAKVLAAATRLKIIAKHGVGYENIDLESARARGIPVTIAGGAIADSVADMTFALLLALARHISLATASVKAGRWERFVGIELQGKVLGLVGLGQIGKAVCRRARGFGLRVVAYDVFPDSAFARTWQVKYLLLEDLLRQVDFVSLHIPVTEATRHLINADRLGLMKPTAYLINTARGELIDEAALYTALQRGALAGAASDVFTNEPPGAEPLLQLDNFIATPHSAGQTREGLRRMGEVTAENVMRVLRGEPALYRVT